MPEQRQSISFCAKTACASTMLRAGRPWRYAETGSECSFRPLNSASSPVFALPDLRSASFGTKLGQ
ncbi:hypothetical protein F6S12_06410 [Pseudomonas sp. JV245A]|nr:hypothetical protein [Pseudomonas sp. JV245A]